MTIPIINLSEEVAPEELYIFVNELNPITRHNFNFTKSFCSAAYETASLSQDNLQKYIDGSLNFCPFQPRALGDVALSPYFISAISDYKLEYDADYYRNQINCTYPSRLSAVYAFGDYESCEKVSQKYKWPLDTVHKFNIHEWPLTRIAKVNMEVVSLMRYANKVSDFRDQETVWRHYWSGEGNLQVHLQDGIHDSGVIWEYLIDGMVYSVGSTDQSELEHDIELETIR